MVLLNDSEASTHRCQEAPTKLRHEMIEILQQQVNPEFLSQGGPRHDLLNNLSA